METEPAPPTPVDLELRRNRKWIVLLAIVTAVFLYAGYVIVARVQACGGARSLPYAATAESEAYAAFASAQNASARCALPLKS